MVGNRVQSHTTWASGVRFVSDFSIFIFLFIFFFSSFLSEFTVNCFIHTDGVGWHLSRKIGQHPSLFTLTNADVLVSKTITYLNNSTPTRINRNIYFMRAHAFTFFFFYDKGRIRLFFFIFDVCVYRLWWAGISQYSNQRRTQAIAQFFRWRPTIMWKAEFLPSCVQSMQGRNLDIEVARKIDAQRKLPRCFPLFLLLLFSVLLLLFFLPIMSKKLNWAISLLLSKQTTKTSFRV